MHTDCLPLLHFFFLSTTFINPKVVILDSQNKRRHESDRERKKSRKFSCSVSVSEKKAKRERRTSSAISFFFVLYRKNDFEVQKTLNPNPRFGFKRWEVPLDGLRDCPYSRGLSFTLPCPIVKAKTPKIWYFRN